MSEPEPVWCVAHDEGWCATASGCQFGEKSLSVKTLCKCRVTFPLGSDRRLPDCEGCLILLRRRTKRKAAKMLDKNQDELF